jgi:hypothetical protein
MSFFLFCCLVLIILQGPLGLSGIGTAAITGGAGGLSVFGNFGGGGGGGGVGLGGGIGCGGMAAGYVPWCQQVAVNGMTLAQPGQQVQVQQFQQVPAVVHHHHPQVVRQQVPQVGYTYQPEVPGYGGRGSIALPGGGGGRWSWYANGNGGQYQYPRQYGEFDHQDV